VGAQISIPLGTVPVTLQMLFVFLAGFLLNPFDAFLSMILYLTLGIAGIPVFANFSAGFQHLVGPTAGYLWAFPVAAFTISYLRRVNYFIAGSVGLIIVYLLGWGVLGFFIKDFSKAFIVGVLPFIVVDFLKMLLSWYASRKVKKILGGVVNEEA
jgi:biotin transport system substrate-specific component